MLKLLVLRVVSRICDLKINNPCRHSESAKHLSGMTTRDGGNAGNAGAVSSTS